jgi:hypothetical protein
MLYIAQRDARIVNGEELGYMIASPKLTGGTEENHHLA